MKKPELLAPAGSLKSMRHAYAFGADAVYAGLPKYSLRARNNEFRAEVLALGIAEAHALGKKLFVTVNLFPHNPKVKSFIRDIDPVVALKPDALIMADPGLIMLAREAWPDMPIHLSVQMNTVNAAAVKFWARAGVSRIILSRELSLDEIADIRQQCPDTELEVFVHGALCIANSGRCLLSGYFNKRDSNQGVCTNACRWQYKTLAATEDANGDYVPSAAGGCASGGCGGGASSVLSMDELNAAQDSTCGGTRHPSADDVYFLEEKERPGELLPVFEDEHGTYIMNSKDLRAIEHVQRLCEIGVDSLKIEGRTKSHYYVARTAAAYRAAIDAAVAGKPLDPALFGVLENLANRGYTDGFYQRHHAQDHQNYITGHSRTHKQEFVAEALPDQPQAGWLALEVKNRFAVGDRIEFILPDGASFETVVETMRTLDDAPVTLAPGNGYFVKIPYTGPAGDFVLVSRFL